MSATSPRAALVRPLVLVVAVLVAYAVVGVVAGVVWELVWTPPSQVVQQHQVFYADYGSLRRVFTGTGLYVLVGGGASALLALVMGVLTRRRELLTLLAVLVGSSVAAVVMWKVGVHLGPADPAAAAATAADGTKLPGQLAVSGHSPYVIWPMTSLFVLALVFFAWPGARLRETPPETPPQTPAETTGPRPTEAPVSEAPRG